MPVRLGKSRHRAESRRSRYNSSSSGGSSCSTWGSCSGTSPTRRRRRCCQCCCCHHVCNNLLSTVGPMFNNDDGIGLSKSDASSTLLVWLLLVLQFLVRCIRFFSIQYELTNEAEKNSLYAFLSQCWPTDEPPPLTKKGRGRRYSRKAKKNRVSKGYFTATTRSEGGSSSELLLSPAVVRGASEEKLKKRSVLTVPLQLSSLYTSAPPDDGRSCIIETNYISCIFEAIGTKVLEIVDDVRKELYEWREVHNMITVCCEMTWAVSAHERHVPSETSIQQAIHEHMQMNQRRVNDTSLALYHANGSLRALPSAPIVQQNCVSKNGATFGCYRRLYPTLLPLIHGETAEVHEPYWALRACDAPPPPPSNCRRSTFKLNLICIVVDDRCVPDCRQRAF